MQRSDAKALVSIVVDDTGNGRNLGADLHAIVRETCAEFRYPSVILGWRQDTGRPLFVAVHSYLDVRLDDSECTAIATDYLTECGRLPDVSPPQFIIR